MIEDYVFGRIVIDGTAYTSDVLVFPDRVEDDWWRASGHSVCMADLEDVLAESPEIIVFGQGHPGRMEVPASVREALQSRGIEVIAQPTRNAAQSVNQLVGEKRVVGAFHLTC